MLMNTDAGGVELFVGQVIALIPLRVTGPRADEFSRTRLRRIFPRSLQPPAANTGRRPGRAVRPKTYSVITDGPGHGYLTVRQTEIEVRIVPLDLETPEDATVFRVAGVAGRAIRVTGVVEEPGSGGR
ncbi:hypothetical protein [Microbacterium saccharophilum]|nr:hypothetical protein MSA03_04340 [Microbacterium saccharophilum]